MDAAMNVRLGAKTKEFNKKLAQSTKKIQKFGKLALGETTDRIDIHATTNEGQIFQEAMELIDQVVRERESDDNQGLHWLGKNS